MKSFHEHPSMLLMGGILCAAFALNACAAGDDTPLPPRESPQEHALYEQCLKTMPPDQAAELQRLREELYPTEMAKHDDLLRHCVHLQNETHAP